MTLKTFVKVPCWIMSWFCIFFKSSILLVYQTKGLFIICKPVIDLTKYFLKKRALNGSNVIAGLLNSNLVKVCKALFIFTLSVIFTYNRYFAFLNHKLFSDILEQWFGLISYIIYIIYYIIRILYHLCLPVTDKQFRLKVSFFTSKIILSFFYISYSIFMIF